VLRALECAPFSAGRLKIYELQRLASGKWWIRKRLEYNFAAPSGAENEMMPIWAARAGAWLAAHYTCLFECLLSALTNLCIIVCIVRVRTESGRYFIHKEATSCLMND